MGYRLIWSRRIRLLSCCYVPHTIRYTLEIRKHTAFILINFAVKIEWLCHKLSGNLVERLKKTKSATQEASLNFCYKLTILLQDMDHNERIPFDPLVGPLFEFCCNRIKNSAAHSNFPASLDVAQTIDTILVGCDTCRVFPYNCKRV